MTAKFGHAEASRPYSPGARQADTDTWFEKFAPKVCSYLEYAHFYKKSRENQHLVHYWSGFNRVWRCMEIESSK